MDITEDPNELAPFVTKDSAYKFASGLMDEPKVDLSAADSASFPFVLSGGYASLQHASHVHHAQSRSPGVFW